VTPSSAGRRRRPNGHPDRTPRKARKDQGFQPTPKQLSYARQYLEAVIEGQPLSDVALAPKVPVDPTHISKWRRSDRFCVWLTGVCTVGHRGGLARLLVRALRLGLKGSIDHAKFYAVYSGEAPAVVFDPDAPPPGMLAPQFTFLVPRPQPVSAPQLGTPTPTKPAPGLPDIPTIALGRS
jgi:hypothetical protein